MTHLKLNQRLKSQLNELQSLAIDDHTSSIFILDKILFDVDEVVDLTNSKERLIMGRIFPTSDIFKEGAFQIEIKLPSIYPLDPPKVRFITPIYHPNVAQNGEFYHEFLLKTARWISTATLLDVIKTVVDRIDKPEADYSVNQEVAEEYVQNRTEFDRRALEMVKEHSLSRS